ncbi:MAG: amidohydrolase family protein [Candidatus Marinimicrobia bacterium]|mgnify:FL=1|jgi:putative selenium metabolism protein SsnA|nr:amidohydrolase family protein [Candidatus Neomarinimicrobiota bacterium]MBT3632175.1 amidohydrolase family protein [Candidatus Neomarinimicrobiota bacterium]MBT3824330.1 amidohydrolase family protein [Candidatus Neomarinimicrobiota bacterium]MBT4130043.1 amidohydrolase family protein [Candidatus Neomarinimicrobiota bacterium]MBT4295030.1 amidohydrolase family protein [Candidatus Neomarinimicrobiota bacterium]
MEQLLLHNLRIIDPFGEREFLEHASILIENETIKFVGRGFSHVGFDGQILDMQGKTVLPGIINAHTHLYSTLAMGMHPPQKSPKNFVEHLEEVWWKLDRGLDKASTRASFEAGLMDCIQNGTTTIIDHHASPLFVDGSLDLLGTVAESFGVNISLCFECSDRNGEANFKDELMENIRAIKKYASNPYISPRLGLHASFTLSDKSLEMVSTQLKDFPDCGIHIHVAEDLADEKDAQTRGYRSVIQRLDDYKLLSNQSLIIHGIFMTREDRHILLKHGCKLVHNPTSNANNQVGVLETEIIESLNPGLGTDGMQNNLLKEAKEGTLVRAATESLPVDYLELLFQNNPDIALKIFGKLVGHIEEEAQADLVFYDYDPRTELTADNFSGHLLFGLGQPTDVMTRGTFRMRNKQLVGKDETRIRETARKQSKRLWSAMKAL